jgi:hypothetical protein
MNFKHLFNDQLHRFLDSSKFDITTTNMTSILVNIRNKKKTHFNQTLKSQEICVIDH